MRNINVGKFFILFCSTLVGASIGILWLPSVWQFFQIKEALITNSFTNGLIGSVGTFFIALIFSTSILKFINSIESNIEQVLKNKSPFFLIAASLGTIVGLLIGVLLSNVFNYLSIPIISQILPVIVILLFGYFGFRLGSREPESFRRIFSLLRPKTASNTTALSKQKERTNYKLLDTNTLIDGRVYDILKIGFIEGTIIVPLFVVQELQYIADSSDSLKRAKGRLGLDILNKIQSLPNVTIELLDKDFNEIHEVDSKLVKLAQDLKASIVTNDFNLNKVCQIQNIPVLNINELANALKPNLVTGDTIDVVIVKQGNEKNQGVAYLNDGTMVVVEDGNTFINDKIEVTITSTLQTAAGRMIFAKASQSKNNIK